jgi:hypothetical protein
MEKEKKMTKKDYFNELKVLVEGTDIENKGELIYFIESQIASIDAKAEKAKERAAAKRAEGDELRETVKSVLTNEFQTAEEITAKVGDEEISKAKVIARLTQLVNLGEAVKEQTKTEDNKSKMTYKLAD